MPSIRTLHVRATGWLHRWRGALPIFVAEFIAWLGFGALLPVMPLYFQARGIDITTYGIIVAAWPATMLVGEPAFGVLADRTARKPFMVVGLVATAVFVALPLATSGALAFTILRGLAGLATAAYNPAARGFLADATPPDRQGEAFGLYGAAQMGGILFGPALGGLFGALTGDVTIVFLVCSLATMLAALAVAVAVREAPGVHLPTQPLGPAVLSELPPGDPAVLERAAVERRGEAVGGATTRERPTRLVNRLLVAAIILSAGSAYAGGTYEVIWSIWLTSMGAGLDFIGITFVMFGLPMLVVSPFAGRLVDRGGLRRFVVGGSLAAAVAGVLYGLMRDPILALPIGVLEGVGFAFLSPALFTIASAGSPAGRTSTAQGLFGAAGTVGFIVASLSTGLLAEVELRLPFFVFAAVMTATLALGLAVGGPAITRLGPVAVADTAPSVAGSPAEG